MVVTHRSHNKIHATTSPLRIFKLDKDSFRTLAISEGHFSRKRYKLQQILTIFGFQTMCQVNRPMSHINDTYHKFG